MATRAERILKLSIVGDSKGFGRASSDAQRKLDGWKGTFAKWRGRATVASLAVIGAFIAVGKSAVDSLLRIEQLSARTDAAIESTGGAAGRTRTQIEALAGQIERMTGAEAETVQEGQNLLLTFTSIQGANFDRATEAMVDMGVAMNKGSLSGLDLQATAIQVGKALNDPIKGATALRRVGVQLTEQQEQQIATMVEAGDVAGAQGVILEELERQFGGAADAAGNTLAGSVAKARHRFGELTETLTVSLLPAISKLLDIGLKAIDWAQRNEGVVKSLAAVVGGLVVAWLALNAAIAISTLLASPWLIALAAITAAVVLAIVHWGKIKAAVGAAMDFALTRTRGFLDWLRRNWPMLFAILTGPFGLAVLAIVKNKDKILEVVKSIPDKIRGFFSGVAETLTAPFRAAIGAIRTAWNRTLGGKGFEAPSWLPGIGGKSFRIPRLHHGGIVPGRLGEEVPILARGGERVLTREQQLTGPITINVQAFDDRFRLGQILDDVALQLALRGV